MRIYSITENLCMKYSINGKKTIDSRRGNNYYKGKQTPNKIY